MPASTSAKVVEVVDRSDALYEFNEKLDRKLQRFSEKLAKLFGEYGDIFGHIEDNAYIAPGDIDQLALAMVLRDYDLKRYRNRCEADDAPFFLHIELISHFGRLTRNPR